MLMDDMPLPLDVARSLLDRYGMSAMEVVSNRAKSAQQTGDMKAHDHALLVLTEIEELVQEQERADQPTRGMSDHRLV
jgi:hypothetical protein